MKEMFLLTDKYDCMLSAEECPSVSPLRLFLFLKNHKRDITSHDAKANLSLL
jgi:hypothetical protein